MRDDHQAVPGSSSGRSAGSGQESDVFSGERPPGGRLKNAPEVVFRKVIRALTLHTAFHTSETSGRLAERNADSVFTLSSQLTH